MGTGINLGFCFGGWNGWGGWGWGPNWFGRTVIVNNNFFHHYGFHGGNGTFNRAAWVHNPAHRLGIPYPNRQVSGRFQGPGGHNPANPPMGGRNSFQGGQNPGNLPNGGGRNAFQGGANRMAVPGNPGPQGGRNPVMPPNAGRNSFQGGANRMAVPGNPGFQGAPARGGAARSFPAPQSRPMQPVPHSNPGFGGGGMRGSAVRRRSWIRWWRPQLRRWRWRWHARIRRRRRPRLWRWWRPRWRRRPSLTNYSGFRRPVLLTRRTTTAQSSVRASRTGRLPPGHRSWSSAYRTPWFRILWQGAGKPDRYTL